MESLNNSKRFLRYSWYITFKAGQLQYTVFYGWRIRKLSNFCPGIVLYVLSLLFGYITHVILARILTPHHTPTFLCIVPRMGIGYTFHWYTHELSMQCILCLSFWTVAVKWLKMLQLNIGCQKWNHVSLSYLRYFLTLTGRFLKVQFLFRKFY
jgi:hypothetical protein